VYKDASKEHERISHTGVFLSLDRVSGTLCLSHYATEIFHLYSLRDFWRHFGLCRAAAHSDCCFFSAVYKYSYLLTYLLTLLPRSGLYVHCNWRCCRLYPGISNLLGSFVSAYPVTASFSRFDVFDKQQTSVTWNIEN